ncbi:MAG: GAF domain-containing protein [Anaerolineales bacterium]|nr:GAF domain-containing protein [Anaerolineales bacterium]
MDNPRLLSQLTLPEDREIWAEHRRDIVETPGLHEVQLRIRRRNGETRWVEHACQPVTGEQGVFLGYRASNRDVTARKRAEEQVRRNAARAEALARTAARLNARLDLDMVLNVVCEEVASAMNVPAAWINLYDERRDVLDYAGTFGLPPEFGERYTPSPRALYEEYAQRMGPLLVFPDVQALSAISNAQLYAALNIRTVANASMLREGQLVGVLSVVTFGETRHFTDDELALLQGLADQAAQAITNARLFNEAQRRLQHMQALREIDMAITASLDVRVTFNVILDQVITQLGVDAADVLLFHPHTQTLEYATGRGFRSRALWHTSLRLGEGYAGRAAFERRIVNVPNLEDAENGLRRAPLLPHEDFVAYYAVPLIAKGDVKGVLEIFHRASLDPDPEWLDFLDTLAGQAAVAIDNATLFDDLQRSNVELTLAYDTTLEGWSRALDLRDKETEGHTQRVAEMTLRLAQAMGISNAELVHNRRGALLHDIGKMGIPDAILHKPGPLTDEEWEIMRKHPVYAYEMLSPIAYLHPALDIPYCHHEKWDGTGYPRGLKGETIPLSARVFSVVDVWDALRSDRPYRKAWPEEKVLAHIREQAGKHFDPQVMEVFLKMEVEDEGMG